MSMAEIMREVADWPSERQDELAAFLLHLRLEKDSAWAEEAECRYSEVKSGRAKCIPGREVLRRVRLRNK
jgi:hypothetical protein